MRLVDENRRFVHEPLYNLLGIPYRGEWRGPVHSEQGVAELWKLCFDAVNATLHARVVEFFSAVNKCDDHPEEFCHPYHLLLGRFALAMGQPIVGLGL